MPGTVDAVVINTTLSKRRAVVRTMSLYRAESQVRPDEKHFLVTDTASEHVLGLEACNRHALAKVWEKSEVGI